MGRPLNQGDLGVFGNTGTESCGFSPDVHRSLRSGLVQWRHWEVGGAQKTPRTRDRPAEKWKSVVAAESWEGKSRELLQSCELMTEGLWLPGLISYDHSSAFDICHFQTDLFFMESTFSFKYFFYLDVYLNDKMSFKKSVGITHNTIRS